GPDSLIRNERRSSARCRNDYRSRRCGSAGRHPLRDAATCALWPDGHMSRVICHVQYERGGGRAFRLARQSAGIFRMTEDSLANAPATEKPPENAAVVGSPALPQDELNKLTDDIVAALKTVYDPEIPADIYELGLIYKIDIGDDRGVKIDIPRTWQNCPGAQDFPSRVENAVSRFRGVKGTKVAVVWAPPWDPSRMSDEARLVLNMW